jgi:hypothetical protein
MACKDFYKNSINIANIANKKTRDMVENGVSSYFCANVDEKIPEFDDAPCEKVISGKHNAFVVLGRDRHASWASGHGGHGILQCGMIDLVAGRGQLVIANNKKECKENPMEGVEFVGPMFHSDAARVYITQKAEDIDMYFSLPQSGGPTSVNKSAVAAKADQIRIIGREKVRIYCGRGKFEGFEKGVGETNCEGERLRGQVIELQVGDQEMHPMVLGNKLTEYLKKQQEVNRKVYKQLLEMNIHLTTLNAAVSVLTFGAPPYLNQMRESMLNIKEDVEFSLNSIIQTINYLDADLIPGSEHILSDSVYTT